MDSHIYSRAKEKAANRPPNCRFGNESQGKDFAVLAVPNSFPFESNAFTVNV